ncbi:hypothetical protein OnM2_021023 [Erysiphe neolycopersici]|uniref:Uncharacterized protein n=1 Tax=Erysiphe neolycopersici TaxID=212602 RepID=A0A420I2X5_9PEZI|nr:hypothetical protein OnM2_021023 [Erysiphe neolycopersici]
MPNLVHSLDASSLAFHNIFTVHDCFAVTANRVYFGEDAINDELLIKPSLYEGIKLKIFYTQSQ